MRRTSLLPMPLAIILPLCLCILAVSPLSTIAVAPSTVSHHGHPSRTHHPPHTSGRVTNTAAVNSNATSSILLQYYETLQCSGVSDFNLSFTSGLCSAYNSGSSSWYCDEESAYSMIYSDTGCQNLSSIFRQPLGCAQDNTNYQCVNEGAGPLPPFSSWPPASMKVTSYCGKNGLDCPTSPLSPSCYESAYPVNQCLPLPNSQQPQLYTEYFCQDANWEGFAIYNDSNCDIDNLISIDLMSTMCNSNGTGGGGGSTTPVVGQPLMPSNQYPQSGYITWGSFYVCYDEPQPGTVITFQPIGTCSTQEIMIVKCQSEQVVVDQFYNSQCQGKGWSQISSLNQCTSSGLTYFCNGPPFQI